MTADYPIFKLDTLQGWRKFSQVCRDHEYESMETVFHKTVSFSDYVFSIRTNNLKNFKFNLTCGPYRLFGNQGLRNIVVMQKGAVYSAKHLFARNVIKIKTLEKATLHAPLVVFVANPKTHDDGKFAIVNGDEINSNDENFPAARVAFFPRQDWPTYSHSCLTRLAGGTARSVTKALQSGQMRLMDYTADSEIPLKASEKQRLKDGKLVMPPEPGYTQINDNQWHRAATTLFYNQKKGEYYLLGQDEGTYFGVHLSRPVTKVESAFKQLVPYKARGKKYERQGEWFMVQIKEKDLPKVPERSFEFHCWNGMNSAEAVRFHLPLDDPHSNLHTLTLKTGFVADGIVYAKQPYLEHPEHATIGEEGWVYFLRNTALRSVSVKGVD